jgi:hypothetical protein
VGDVLLDTFAEARDGVRVEQPAHDASAVALEVRRYGGEICGHPGAHAR